GTAASDAEIATAETANRNALIGNLQRPQTDLAINRAVHWQLAGAARADRYRCANRVRPIGKWCASYRPAMRPMDATWLAPFLPRNIYQTLPRLLCRYRRAITAKANTGGRGATLCTTRRPKYPRSGPCCN